MSAPSTTPHHSLRQGGGKCQHQAMHTGDSRSWEAAKAKSQPLPRRPASCGRARAGASPHRQPLQTGQLLRTIHENDTAARNGRRRAVVHVVDLEQQAHGVGQRNALVGGQGEHLVVILWRGMGMLGVTGRDGASGSQAHPPPDDKECKPLFDQRPVPLLLFWSRFCSSPPLPSPSTTLPPSLPHCSARTMTVFMLSIHSASMSPSSTIHWCWHVLFDAISRNMLESCAQGSGVCPDWHARLCIWGTGGGAAARDAGAMRLAGHVGADALSIPNQIAQPAHLMDVRRL